MNARIPFMSPLSPFASADPLKQGCRVARVSPLSPSVDKSSPLAKGDTTVHPSENLKIALKQGGPCPLASPIVCNQQLARAIRPFIPALAG